MSFEEDFLPVPKDEINNKSEEHGYQLSQNKELDQCRLSASPEPIANINLLAMGFKDNNEFIFFDSSSSEKPLRSDGDDVTRPVQGLLPPDRGE